MTALDDYLDRLRGELDRIDDLRQGWTTQERSPGPGNQAAILLGHLARLQRLSGWAMRAAIAQARAAGMDWEALAPAAQVHLTRLPGQVDAGGRVVVDDDTSQRQADRGATEASRTRPAAVDAAAPVGVLHLVEAQLDAVAQALREAIGDYHELVRIRGLADDPRVAGRAAAHRDLATTRWSNALGARVELEALYQQLAGAPSPRHAADTRVLAQLGLPPNPVGLSGRHPDTAAFLQAHATDCQQLPAPAADRHQPAPGLEL